VDRSHRWVLWWFEVGLGIAVVTLPNLPYLNLTRSEERLLFILCAVHWLLAGLICWAFADMKSAVVWAQPPKAAPFANVPEEREWHPASEFRLPGSVKILVPLSLSHHRRETLEHYALHHSP
jgi:hypothetical protein